MDDQKPRETMNKAIMDLHLFHTQDKIDLIEKFRDVLGEKALDAVESVERDKAEEQWKAVAEKMGCNGLKELLETLWLPLREKGFEFTWEETADSLRFRCTKCPIADMGELLGGKEILFRHTCQADYGIVKGFNPEIILRREKTLMLGDDCCDHHYMINRKTKAQDI